MHLKLIYLDDIKIRLLVGDSSVSLWNTVQWTVFHNRKVKRNTNSKVDYLESWLLRPDKTG